MRIAIADISSLANTWLQGKFIVTGGIVPGEKSECSGKVQVTETSISAEYTCAGVTSHDPATGPGKVDIKVRFTVKS